MTSNIGAATEAKTETEAITELLTQARSLAARVATLPEGPRKQRLKSALDEMQAIADHASPALVARAEPAEAPTKTPGPALESQPAM